MSASLHVVIPQIIEQFRATFFPGSVSLAYLLTHADSRQVDNSVWQCNDAFCQKRISLVKEYQKMRQSMSLYYSLELLFPLGVFYWLIYSQDSRQVDNSLAITMTLFATHASGCMSFHVILILKL